MRYDFFGRYMVSMITAIGGLAVCSAANSPGIAPAVVPPAALGASTVIHSLVLNPAYGRFYVEE